jgi:hypothetical protein
VERDSSCVQLDDERGVVDSLEEPGAELTMNGDRRADDRVCELFVFERHDAQTRGGADD